MAQIAYLTTAGQAAIADARFNGYRISIVQYKVGDTLVTETDPAVIRNYTTLPGSIVYDSGVSPTDNTLTYSVTSEVGIIISVYLNSAIGDFTLGSVGLYLEDGTLFAILVLDETYSKVKNSGSVAGNIITFPFTFVITIQDVLDLEITPEGVASLPYVNTELDLPDNSTLTPYSNYFVKNLAGTGQSAIASKVIPGWQYTLASNHDVFENWLKVDPANFDASAIDGTAVYYNLTTGNWSSLDGDGLEQKVYGIRLGNGVRTAGFYYKLSSFVPGYDYYVDALPAAGRLTTRSSKYFVGTAVNTSLLKLNFSYLDNSFDGSEKVFYQAAIDSNGVICLTLDDQGRYPDSYLNGTRIAFVCPITVTDNQRIKLGDLGSVYLTKRVSSPTGYGTKLELNDILLGTLVECVYLSIDEGFRCTSGVRASSNTLGTQLLKPNENYLINGNFDFWQRGTSFSSSGSGLNQYTADRWRILADYSTSIVRGDISPGELLSEWCDNAKYFATVNKLAAGGDNNTYFTQRIEDVWKLSNKLVTVSFAAKTLSGTRTMDVWIEQNFGSGGSSLASTTHASVTLTTTWTRYTVTLQVPSVFGKTIGAGHNTGLVFNDSTTDATFTWYIAGVKVEDGAFATGFKSRPQEEELALCQRYYEFFGGQSINETLCSAYAPNTTHGDGVIHYKVEKRGIPSISFSGNNLFRFNNATSNYRSSAVAAVNPTTKTFIMSLTISGVSPNVGGCIDTYDATGFVYIDAEL